MPGKPGWCGLSGHNKSREGDFPAWMILKQMSGFVRVTFIKMVVLHEAVRLFVNCEIMECSLVDLEFRRGAPEYVHLFLKLPCCIVIGKFSNPVNNDGFK